MRERPAPERFHLHGCMEERATTGLFNVMVPNRTDYFHRPGSVGRWACCMLGLDRGGMTGQAGHRRTALAGGALSAGEREQCGRVPTTRGHCVIFDYRNLLTNS